MPVPEFRLAFPYPDPAVIELPRWQQPDSRTRNALIRSLRGLGERGFALLTQRRTTLQNVTTSPSRIADIAKAALVLVQFEHKMIELKSLGNLNQSRRQSRHLSALLPSSRQACPRARNAAESPAAHPDHAAGRTRAFIVLSFEFVRFSVPSYLANRSRRRILVI
jgi:hypothetical protein